MKKILLVDDHQIVRDALRNYFEEDVDYAIEGEASNGIEALELLAKQQYDVVICDVNMPVMNGIELMNNIRRLYPDQKVLILTMEGNAGIIKKLVSLGVDGYILKNSRKELVIDALQQVLQGENYFSTEVCSAVIDHLSSKNSKPGLSNEVEFSKREMEVLQLIIAERSNQEIADILLIDIRTVSSHKRNLLDKTQSKNIAGLVRFAMENNIQIQVG